MSPSQKRVVPVLAFAAALGLAFFTWSAVGGSKPSNGDDAPKRPTLGGSEGGKSESVPDDDGPTIAPPRNGHVTPPDDREKTARERLEQLWTWDPKAAAEIVGLLRPDPLRKLAAIIEGGASPQARKWAIQLAAALSANPDWDSAPNTPPPQPAPVTDPRLFEALRAVIADGGEDPDVRKTAVAIMPLELDGRPNAEVLDLFAGVLRGDDGAKAAVFSRFDNWFGTGEAAQQGFDRVGAAVQAAALRTLSADADPATRQAAARVLRWGDPSRSGPAVLAALATETDPAVRTALLGTAASTAPQRVSEAWANGDLKPLGEGEEVQLSAVIGKAAREGDMMSFAVAQQRFRERMAAGPTQEVEQLLDSMTGMASISDRHRAAVLEYFREQRARPDVTDHAARVLDKMILALDP